MDPLGIQLKKQRTKKQSNQERNAELINTKA